MDEQERLRWQLEKVKDSLRGKTAGLREFKGIRGGRLRSTDSRLDSIDEELKAVSQALLAIGEITRRDLRGVGLKASSAFASGSSWMEDCGKRISASSMLGSRIWRSVSATGEQTTRAPSDESYGRDSLIRSISRHGWPSERRLSDRDIYARYDSATIPFPCTIRNGFWPVFRWP